MKVFPCELTSKEDHGYLLFCMKFDKVDCKETSNDNKSMGKKQLGLTRAGADPSFMDLPSAVKIQTSMIVIQYQNKDKNEGSSTQKTLFFLLYK